MDQGRRAAAVRRSKTRLRIQPRRGGRGAALAEHALFLGAATLVILLAVVVTDHKVADIS